MWSVHSLAVVVVVRLLYCSGCGHVIKFVIVYGMYVQIWHGVGRGKGVLLLGVNCLPCGCLIVFLTSDFGLSCSCLFGCCVRSYAFFVCTCVSHSYYSGDPKNRMKGAWNMFGLLGLLVTTAVFGVRLILPA